MIELVENKVSADGMGFVKVVSDQAVREAWMRSLVPGAAREFAVVHCYATAALSLFYGEVTYPVREVIEMRGACGEGRVRRFAVWRMMESEGYRMSEIIEFLAEWYFVQTKRRAGYAFVKKLSVNSDQLSVFEDEVGVLVLEAEWCLEKCVMVGGG